MSAAGRCDAEHAVRRAAALGAPTIATAGAASAAAMLVLLLSPVPMVRGFAVLLVGGVLVAFLCALTAGAAAMTLSGRRAARPGARARRARSRAARSLRPGAERASCCATTC